MYLVELGSGKDTVYPSAGELAAAIRRGDLDAAARIYHRTTCQWLPITVHPEYRRAAAQRVVATALRPPRRQWTFLRDATVDAPEPATPAAGPELFPGDPEPSLRQTLGLAVRRLRYLTRVLPG